MDFCVAYIPNCVTYSDKKDNNGQRLCARCFDNYDSTNKKQGFTNNFILS